MEPVSIIALASGAGITGIVAVGAGIGGAIALYPFACAGAYRLGRRLRRWHDHRKQRHAERAESQARARDLQIALDHVQAEVQQQGGVFALPHPPPAGLPAMPANVLAQYNKPLPRPPGEIDMGDGPDEDAPPLPTWAARVLRNAGIDRALRDAVIPDTQQGANSDWEARAQTQHTCLGIAERDIPHGAYDAAIATTTAVRAAVLGKHTARLQEQRHHQPEERHARTP